MNEQYVLDELLEIQRHFELLKGKNGYEPSNEMSSLWKKCLTLMQTVPINMEYQLIQTDRFREVASSICQLSMEAEIVEELHYAEQLQYPESLLSNHSYTESLIHYKQVIHLELSMIKTVMKVPIEEIVFIGCGPLPISSYELIIQLPELKNILNIDYDTKAIQLAKSIIENNCSHFDSDKMSFLQIDAGQLTRESIKAAQLIYYSAMVGQNIDEKTRILTHIYEIMLDGQVLLVRTSRGLRQIFYPLVDISNLQQIGFKLQLETHSYMNNDVVTSIVIVMK